MKRIAQVICLLLAIGLNNKIIAQDENVGIGTKNPDNSAVLDIQSANKGLLIPRMTLNERDAINNPADGLMIYQTNESSGFYFFNGDLWTPLSASEAKSVASDPNDWTINGNAASAGNFIGTTNGVPLQFKVSNTKAGTIYSGENTFFGMQSGYTTTINGGTDLGNTGFGYKTLASLTTNEGTLKGVSNVAIGSRALENNTEGSWNLAIGEHALRVNATGYTNTVIGVRTMVSNISGFRNVAIGAGAMRAKTSGSYNTAIGINALENNITGDNNVAIGYFAGQNELGSDKLYIANSNTTTPLIYGNFSAKFVSIGDVEPAKREAANTSGGYKLIVEGGVLTEKVKVALKSSTDWADYVFEDDYELLSLEEVEKFTKLNKHLPNVPSADDMVLNGLEVGQTSKMFMEKIEELTLYMIEMNKEIISLKKENKILQEKIK